MFFEGATKGCSAFITDVGCDLINGPPLDAPQDQDDALTCGQIGEVGVEFPKLGPGWGFDGGKCVEVTGPVRPGDTLTAKSLIADIYEKTGRSGTMVFIVHRMVFTNQKGEPVSTVDWRLIQKAA